MKTSKTTRVLSAWALGAALVSAPPAALAAATSVSAAIDAVVDSDVRTDGGLASAAVAAPGGGAAVIGDLTYLHITGSDTTHFSAGAPGAGGFSDFYFEVQGATGLVDLEFHFDVLGGFTRDELTTFTSSGSFAAFLTSGAGPSPYTNGNFNVVQCIGCGGRLSIGSITTIEDYYGPGTVTTVPWEGGNPGPFTLRSTFLAGTPSAGRLQLNIGGGGGNSSFDFKLALTSITAPGAAPGLSLYDAGSGFRLGVTSGAVPEPQAWAMMIAGFGMAGAVLRHRRRIPVG